MKKIISMMIAVFIFAIMQVPAARAGVNNDALYSVVYIESYKFYNDEPLIMATGSGTLVSQDGIILTNNHVVTDETGVPYDAFKICYLASLVEPLLCDEIATILDYDTDLDLAILYPAVRYNPETDTWDEIPADDTVTYNPITFRTTSYDDADLPQLREEISIAGYPAASLTGSINTTKGQITGNMPLVIDEATQESIIWYLETDALINPGSSGGAALDTNDRFAGVPTMISTTGESGQYGYIIPVTIVNYYFDSLVDEGILTYNPNQYVYGDTQMALEDAISAGQNLTLSELSNLGDDVQLFFDVNETHPNYDAIKFLKENKIISGYLDGYFKPENEITRAELMKILSLATGTTIDAVQYQNCFPDVTTDWYAQYVCYAKSKGWIQGYPDGTFKPGQKVVKAEAIKMVLNTQGVIIEENVAVNPFGDVSKTEWYAKYVQTAKNLGLLEETGSLYHPASNATRGGVSENIYRVIKP